MSREEELALCSLATKAGTFGAAISAATNQLTLLTI
jgi:hypothetical protein